MFFCHFDSVIICHKIGQLKLLGDFERDGPDLSEVTVTSELVSRNDIGEKKPAVIGNSKTEFIFNVYLLRLLRI